MERARAGGALGHAGRGCWREGLRQRWRKAERELRALTPAPERGKQQITEKTALKATITKILGRHEVSGWLRVKSAHEKKQVTRYAGRGLIRLLKVFARGEITRTRFTLGRVSRWHITELTALMEQPLGCLDLPASLYTQLADSSSWSDFSDAKSKLLRETKVFKFSDFQFPSPIFQQFSR